MDTASAFVKVFLHLLAGEGVWGRGLGKGSGEGVWGRGLGKGTALESPSPAALSKSFRRSLCSQKPRSLRFEIRPGLRPFARILPGVDSPAQSVTAADCNTPR